MVLLAAPLVSAALIGGVFATMNMLDPPAAVMARSLSETIMIYLATGCLYGAGFGLFGAVSALVGRAATRLFTLWVMLRASARLTNKRRDSQAIQAEPGAAADLPRD